MPGVRTSSASSSTWNHHHREQRSDNYSIGFTLADAAVAEPSSVDRETHTRKSSTWVLWSLVYVTTALLRLMFTTVSNCQEGDRTVSWLVVKTKS